MRIRWFQHVSFEGLGSIEPWARERRHDIRVTRFYRDEPVPDSSDFDWLIVMGGPMGVGDEALFPWLTREKKAIENAIRASRAVLGICLGAQLIGNVLGAPVYRNEHREIGWFPVELTEPGRSSPLFGSLPERFEAFHWHGDTFDLPAGAIHIARSEACRHQAFQYGDRVVGLQFHLETTPQSAADLVQNCADELVEGPFIQPASDLLAPPERFRVINQAMSELLSRMEAGVP